MLQQEAVRDGTAIICETGFGAQVACEHGPICVVDSLGNSWTRAVPGFDLRGHGRHVQEKGGDNDPSGGESQFSEHRSLP